MSGGCDPQGMGESRDAAEDTVELELSAAEQLELARAADAAFGPSQVEPKEPGYDTFVYMRTRRADVAGTITFAALVCAITAAVGWHSLIGEPASTSVATPAAVTAPSIPPMAPARAVVQVPNPFDATEVFELPAETSEADARSAIAEVLLQRAQERRSQGLHLRGASRHHMSPIPASKPADVFVTRVLGPANRFADAPGPQSGIAE
jgi:hypothetical protein